MKNGTNDKLNILSNANTYSDVFGIILIFDIAKADEYIFSSSWP